MICYYTGKTTTSLRAPYKVGGTWFVKGASSTKNQYKAADIDTVNLETTISNPASYFAYNKISRAHEFFDSNDYLHLEKKFQYFRTLDVSKCFSSIYTHTLFWAVSDVQTAKDNTTSSGFANEFDRLMQSMNYNETNGICIGPEISRVFAEIIFSEIDKRVIRRLADRGLKFHADYEFRRYVDDFYVFSQDEITAAKVTAAVEHCLAEFNLHINTEKTLTICRPFATKKSQIIADTNRALDDFFEKFIDYRRVAEQSVAVPLRIIRSDALMRSFIKTVKATCTHHNTGYDTVSDYIVSALSKRVAALSDDFSVGITLDGVREELYVSANVLLVEMIYFFYTVNPTVRASLNVARAAIVSTRLFSDNFPDRLAFLSENVVRWTLDLARSIARGKRHKDLTAIPVEVLNILLPMRDVAGSEPLVAELVESLCSDVSAFQYFEIVSFLFLMAGKPKHRAMTARLFARAKLIVNDGLGPRVDSQSAHLCLDLLACPYLPFDKRGSWFNSLRSKCGIPMVSKLDAQSAVIAMEAHPWFVRWEGVDLLRILRKKELSAVY